MRPNHPGECGYLPLMVCAELEDAVPGAAFDGQQGLGHAYLVVVVLFVKNDGKGISHQVDEQLFRCRFAVAAGYGDERARDLFPLETGEVEKGLICVVHKNDGALRLAVNVFLCPVAEAAARGTPVGRIDKRMTVEIGARQGNEEFTCVDGPRIGRDSGELSPLDPVGRTLYAFYDRVNGPH
ncbi:MAG: hypothetical protein A4E57_01057 [Syntrophorhabdaceae bacterium PtaU1.Bin034]|nr:MAG: hypothetical protein A4E57_01057 [Syntrophorhabdaceae bacterium PtaU1.Bin034]